MFFIFHHFSSFFTFFHFLHFSSFFHSLSFSSFSVILFHVLSFFFFFFSFVFSFFLFLFLFVGGSKPIFFWTSISLRFLLTFPFEKINFSARVGEGFTLLGPLFSWILFFFSFFFLFCLKCFSLFVFLFWHFVSGFNKSCFLRSRCSTEMWCSDDIGRDSWDWVGPPAWRRACFNFPEWGGGSSSVKTERPQIVLLLLWWFVFLLLSFFFCLRLFVVYCFFLF